MRKRILVAGGGTAGWMTAAYLARRLATDLPGGVAVTLVESHAIGVLGVGEGTFPTIRRTLATIGISEVELVRRCGATFKQGAKFVHWRSAPGEGRFDHYVHPFQEAVTENGLELLPYWLLGAGGDDRNWDEVATPQTIAADAHRAPKLPTHPDYVGPLNYAFHFDAVALAGLLKEHGIRNGVHQVVDTITHVSVGEDGAIDGVHTAENGVLSADLYIDCTGFRAELIGRALGIPFRSCRETLFCDRALATQLPYDAPDAPIQSYTIATAKPGGWIWDIGLAERRGIGHVYSSDHMADDAAERILRDHVGSRGDDVEVRRLRFEGGYREVNWRRNCVAIGLSSGFFEPLEATGIAFAEVAMGMVANLFPWSGDYDTSARQFNANMLRRYERARDFIKLHYCLSERRDSAFWHDNVAASSIPDSLHELLDRWRFRPPNELDIDPQVDIFLASSWQYVLYGMGWRTDLSARAGALRFRTDAERAFEDVRRQAQFALENLPSNRDLVKIARTQGFGPQAAR